MQDFLIPQFLEVKAFDGGMTDNYIDCPLNCFQKADNFIVLQDKSLKSRPGSTYLYGNGYRPATTRVGTLINYNNDDLLLVHSGPKVFSYDLINGWSEIKGSSGNSCFPGDSTDIVVSSSQLQEQLWLTSDSLRINPMKIYMEADVPYLVNAGMPALASTPSVLQPGYTGGISDLYAFAANINTKLQAHFADLTQHSAAQSGTTEFSSSDWSITKLTSFLAYLNTVWNTDLAPSHNEDADLAAGRTYHPGKQASSHAWVYSGSYSTIGDIFDDLANFRDAFNAHDEDATAHTIASLHQIGAPVVPLVEHDLTEYSGYVYAFAKSFTYTENGRTRENIGPVTLSPKFDFLEPSNEFAGSVAISSIPDISALENYDTTNVVTKIYRTLGGGSEFFFLASVPDGTSTFTDVYSDSAISSNTRLYTSGGVLDNDPPPKSKYVHIENGVAIWGYLYEGSNSYPYRLRQSVTGDPDSCPSSNNSDLDDYIAGINGARGKHIILGSKKIFRRDGYYDELGNGLVVHDPISTTAGCVSNGSCVQTHDGLFWAGNDGFYFTDGYQVLKISEGLETTYASITSTETKSRAIQGCYDPKRNLILWTAQLQSSSTENDTLFVLNLNQGIRRSSCFTTWSGDTSFSPTAVVYFDGQIVRAGGMTDRTLPGYLFKHGDSYKSDLRMLSTQADPVNWPKKTIIWDYWGPATGFGNNERRKWCSKAMITAKNHGNLSLQVNSINDDYAAGKKSLAVMRFRSENSILKKWGRFPAKGLRCDYKQLQITNAYTYITNSDTIKTATVNATTKTATLDAGHTSHWPSDSVDYYLKFVGDNYTRAYLVTARTDDALTFADSGNNSVSGSQKWELVGYPKDEVFRLQGYIIQYALIGQNQKTFDGTTGANA